MIERPERADSLKRYGSRIFAWAASSFALVIAVPLVPACRRRSSLEASPRIIHDPPPTAPFDAATAVRKVGLAEDAWNTRDPARDAKEIAPIDPLPRSAENLPK